MSYYYHINALYELKVQNSIEVPPSFISFDSNAREVTVATPSEEDVGIYNLQISASLGFVPAENSEQTFKVIVEGKENNCPEWAESLNDLAVL